MNLCISLNYLLTKENDSRRVIVWESRWAETSSPERLSNNVENSVRSVVFSSATRTLLLAVFRTDMSAGASVGGIPILCSNMGR